MLTFAVARLHLTPPDLRPASVIASQLGVSMLSTKQNWAPSNDEIGPEYEEKEEETWIWE